MIGGDEEAFRRLEPIFASLAPGLEAAPRTPARSGEPAAEERGYLHCGPSGAGHFVKMVHNGIEYGLMAALAEGLNVLHHADAGLHERDADAETAPLAHPEHYRYDLDVAADRRAVAARKRRRVLAPRPDRRPRCTTRPRLEGFAGRVSDSGEGRWTSIAAIEIGAPTPVLTTALFERYESRGEAEFANRVLSAMRAQFGGHAEKPA